LFVLFLFFDKLYVASQTCDVARAVIETTGDTE
jgi:hypothetical protein